MKFLLLSVLIFSTLFVAPVLHARVTPEDILNQKRETFNSRLKNYSAENQQKVPQFEKKVAGLNKKQTDILEAQMIRQGEVLNEYVFRNGIEERQADGISRNLQDPIENARYWLTFAHEAVAYQAAKVYVLNLSGESNIKGDINSAISELNGDMNILKGKVEKSRKLIADIVADTK